MNRAFRSSDVTSEDPGGIFRHERKRMGMALAVAQELSETATDLFHPHVVFFGVTNKQGRNPLERHLIQNGTSAGLPEMVWRIDADHGQHCKCRR
jgi:hypothetical protein